MRINTFLLKSIFLLFIGLPASVWGAWAPYPSHLPQFDYSGDRLEKNWDTVAKITYLPFPNEQNAQSILKKYPSLNAHFKQLAKQGKAHPTIIKALQGDMQPHLKAIQDTWRLHFEGKFEQAYKQGMALGPLGAMPAIQSKLMHTQFLVSERIEKLKRFKEINQEIAAYTDIVPDYPFVGFGVIYARARMLQLMSTKQARASGYLKSSIKGLKKLIKQHPSRGIYKLTLSGMYAGIVEKVGSVIGNVAFGATAKKADKLGDLALKNGPAYPVVFYEFAFSLKNMNQKKYQPKIQRLLEQCLSSKPVNAEEALNQWRCKQMLSRL